MTQTFYILDERNVWHQHIAEAARRFGMQPQRIQCGEPLPAGGVGFIRPHAAPDTLRGNQYYYLDTCEWFNWVQDADQVAWYEDKVEQVRHIAGFMPRTLVVPRESHNPELEKQLAEDLTECLCCPTVSKSREGASSKNVRILHDAAALEREIDQAFGPGIPISHCDGGPGRAATPGLQKGYLLLQEFIPHDRTYRVNVIGPGRAVFERYNYKDKPVAQTGNTRAWHTIERPELLEFADTVAEYLGTRWCALDILERPEGGFVLLETSLAWPWNPRDYSDAPIFRTNFKWGQLWDCMFECIVTDMMGGKPC